MRAQRRFCQSSPVRSRWPVHRNLSRKSRCRESATPVAVWLSDDNIPVGRSAPTAERACAVRRHCRAKLCGHRVAASPWPPVAGSCVILHLPRWLAVRPWLRGAEGQCGLSSVAFRLSTWRIFSLRSFLISAVITSGLSGWGGGGGGEFSGGPLPIATQFLPPLFVASLFHVAYGELLRCDGGPSVQRRVLRVKRNIRRQHRSKSNCAVVQTAIASIRLAQRTGCFRQADNGRAQRLVSLSDSRWCLRPPKERRKKRGSVLGRQHQGAPGRRKRGGVRAACPVAPRLPLIERAHGNSCTASVQRPV